MTLEEILKSQGLSDEQVKTITGEMKQNKIFTSSEENMDIRYNKLKGDFDNLTAQHTESTNLIEQLKAGTRDSEKLQGQITNYETQISQLQDQLKQTQLESEIKVALLAAKASDVEYMTFKLKEKGELELDGEGHIKGIDDKIAGLKAQFPTQFGTESGNSKGQVIEENKLPTSEKRDSLTKEELLKKPYAERQQFFNENPAAYKEIMKS
jgi:flagellar biosynthesis chaperone FliJ